MTVKPNEFETNILNRLGVLTDEVADSLNTALNWITEQKLKHVEIRVVDGINIVDMNDDKVKTIRDEVEKRGLFVSSVASPVFKCALDPSRPVTTGDSFNQAEESVDQHFRKLDRMIEIAKLLGTNYIRVFSFWREENPTLYRDDIVCHLKRAASVAEKSGVVLLLENEPSCNGGCAEEVGTLVRMVNSPAFKGLWDPGNELAKGGNAFPEGYDRIKDVVEHVHLKDMYIGKDGKTRCVPLGSGRVPVIAHLKALIADGYPGLFTIETHFVPEGGTRMTGTRMTLDALRALLAEL